MGTLTGLCMLGLILVELARILFGFVYTFYKLIIKIMLSGYKTYIACLLMIAYVFIGYFVLGEPFNTTVLLEAFAIAGLRNGVAK